MTDWCDIARQRRQFLAEHYPCDLCGAPATQALVLGYDHLCDTCSAQAGRDLAARRAVEIADECAAEPFLFNLHNAMNMPASGIQERLTYWGFHSFEDMLYHLSR